jgi:hypothetical protein
VPRGGAWQVRFCSDDARYDGEFDGHCPQGRYRRSIRTMTACRPASTCRSADTPPSSSAKTTDQQGRLKIGPKRTRPVCGSADSTGLTHERTPLTGSPGRGRRARGGDPSQLDGTPASGRPSGKKSGQNGQAAPPAAELPSLR